MPIELWPFDPEWSALFEQSRRELIESLGTAAFRAIEHIGSTAVPELAAKPVIDMVAGVDDLAECDGLEQALSILGYVNWFGDVGRRSFERRDGAGGPTHHLHIAVYGGDVWRNLIAFRDRLRESQSARLDYEELKRELAAKHDDTRAYSAAKTLFIQRLLSTAR